MERDVGAGGRAENGAAGGGCGAGREGYNGGDMEFAYPLVLLLLAAVPALAWLRFSPRRRASVAHPEGERLAGLPRSPWLKLRWLPPALFAAGLALLVAAAARPRKGLAESRVETEGHDIVLLVDTSTSMRETDFSTGTRRLDRLQAAKEVIGKFIEARKDDRIGIVAFAAMPYAITPLSTDHGWLLSQLDFLQTGMLEDGTAIGDAIASAANRLRDSAAESKIIVLLTDGINNAGRLSPMEAAEAAGALGIKIYTVGAAGEARRGGLGGLFAFPSAGEIDEETLKAVAGATGGEYFRASDLAGLERTYEQIDAMEATKVELEAYTRYEDKGMPFLAAGLALLLLEALLGATRLGRLPA